MNSARIPFRKHYALRLCVQSFEHLFDEPVFHSTGLAGFDQVSNSRIEPSVLVDAEDHRWMLSDFQLVNRGLRQKLSVGSDALHHGLPYLFFCNLLHGLRYELKVALV